MSRFLSPLRDSVRGRLLCLVLAVIAPAIVLVGLLVAQAYRNERRSVGEHLLASARTFAALVDHQIGSCETLLRTLAVSPDIARRDWEALDRHARAVVTTPDTWVVLAEADGQ